VARMAFRAVRCASILIGQAAEGCALPCLVIFGEELVPVGAVLLLRPVDELLADRAALRESAGGLDESLSVGSGPGVLLEDLPFGFRRGEPKGKSDEKEGGGMFHVEQKVKLFQ
jgi:hypothetical protein